MYVVGASAFHEDIMNTVDELPNFNNFWKGGEGADYIYTGDVSGNEHSSDALLAEKYHHDILKLMRQDWKWVNSYVKVDKVKPEMVNIIYKAGLIDIEAMKDYFD